MHGAPSGSLDTDRHSIGSINDACVLGNEAKRACIFRCIAFLRKTKAEQISKRSHSFGPRNKMDARWLPARSFMWTWTRFTRPWSSGTIRSSVASPLLSHGAGIARWCALLRMKRESSACVPLCPQFVPNVYALMQHSCPRTSRVIARYPARPAKSSNATPT